MRRATGGVVAAAITVSIIGIACCSLRELLSAVTDLSPVAHEALLRSVGLAKKLRNSLFCLELWLRPSEVFTRTTKSPPLPTHARSTRSAIGRSSSPLRSAVRSAAQRWDIRSASGVPAAS